MKIIRKLVYVFAALVLFMPAVAFAVPVLSFVSPPASTFEAYQGGTYDLSVELNGYLEDTDVDFYVKGPIGEAGEADQLIGSYGFIANGQYTFSWDGMFGGSEPDAGTYQARFVGNDLYGNDSNTLTHQFTFVTEEPAPEPDPEPEPEPEVEPDPEPEPEAEAQMDDEPQADPTPTANVDDSDTDGTDEAAGDEGTDEEMNDEEGETTGDNNQMLMWLLAAAVLGVVFAYFFKSGGSKTTKPKGE